MSGAEVGLALAVFFACGVEAVEALTIVLAVGQTRSWRSALEGVGAALFVLAVIVAALGEAVTTLPVDSLRLVIGILLLLFGLQWLRKAVLRAAGRKALHNEEATYAEETEAAREAPSRRAGFDPYSFTVAAKGVLVEGFEIVLIVVTLGADHHRIGLAAAAAGAAIVLVVTAGYAIRAPLARVPENTLKFFVGVLLTSYGVFWIGEGAGVSWPGEDAILLALIAGILGAALATVFALRRAAPARLAP
jgi:uncharacterized membrane protein